VKIFKLDREFRLTRIFLRIMLVYLKLRILSLLFPSEKCQAKIDQDAFAKLMILLCRDLGNLKGPVMKFGQFMAHIGDFPRKTKLALLNILDSSEFDENTDFAVEVEKQFGQKATKLFLEWEDKPFAAGSIGQVYKATTAQGEKVAVKIKYPGMDKRVRSDIRVLRKFNKVFQLIYKNHDVKGITDFYEQCVLQECNFNFEASSLIKVRELYINQDDILIPNVISSLSNANIITTQYFDCDKLYDYLKTASDEQKKSIVEKLNRFYYFSLDNAGMVQLDPHFGNFLVKQGKLVCIDFGGYTKIDPVSLKIFRNLVNSSRARDSLGLYNHLVDANIIDKSKLCLANFEKYVSPSFFEPFEKNKNGQQNIFQFYQNQLKEPLRSGFIDKSVDMPFLWITYLIFLSLFKKIDQ
jgi:predicted unusual protein kinase regulating ubiquinone biosynthesis (AarF/ABC1/UbiB family)